MEPRNIRVPITSPINDSSRALFSFRSLLSGRGRSSTGWPQSTQISIDEPGALPRPTLATIRQPHFGQVNAAAAEEGSLAALLPAERNDAHRMLNTDKRR